MPDKKSRDISNFLDTYFPNIKQLTDANYYEWKIASDMPIKGDICLEYDGDIVKGSAVLSPRKVVVRGKVLTSAHCGDTFTHPEYRRQGVFSRCVREAVSHAKNIGVDVIYGTPNDQSLPGYENKLGFPRAPHAQVASMIKVLDYDFIVSKFHKRIPVPGLSNLLAYGYSRVLNLRKRSVPINREVRVMGSQVFPPGLDGKWGKSRDEWSYFTFRDTDQLNWRFVKNPNEYQIWLAKLGSECAGYAVTRLREEKGVLKGYLVDFATSGDDPGIFSALLEKAETHLAGQGAITLECLCSATNSYYHILRKYGYKVYSNIWVIVYNLNEIGKDVQANSGLWQFTLADDDGV